MATEMSVLSLDLPQVDLTNFRVEYVTPRSGSCLCREAAEWATKSREAKDFSESLCYRNTVRNVRSMFDCRGVSLTAHLHNGKHKVKNNVICNLFVMEYWCMSKTASCLGGEKINSYTKHIVILLLLVIRWYFVQGPKTHNMFSNFIQLSTVLFDIKLSVIQGCLFRLIPGRSFPEDHSAFSKFVFPQYYITCIYLKRKILLSFIT